MDATQNLEGAIKSYGKTKPSWVFDPVATAPGFVFVNHKSKIHLYLVTTNAAADFLCKCDAMYFCFFALTGQAEQRNAEEGYGNEDI